MVINDDDEVVGLADEDPGGVPVLAVAVSGPQGKVVLRGHKPVLGFVGGHDDEYGQVLLGAMALVEGLHTSIRLGIASVEAITDHRLLHNYVRFFTLIGSESHCLNITSFPWRTHRAA